MVQVAHTEPLSLEHQQQISSLWESLRLKYDLQFAEYSFANAFLFRRKHDYQVLAGNPAYVMGKFDQKHCYFIPTCAPAELKLDHLEQLLCETSCLYPIPEDWLSYFESFHPVITFCRGESDYLYKTSKLQTLSGRALSSRRNLLHQFQDNHAIQSKELSQEELGNVVALLDKWQEHSQQDKQSTDYLACKDAITYFERLKLLGRITYADGAPVGFTIGELLTPKTALMHFAKSLHEVKGVTPHLYQDFATHLPDSVEWINLEQDLCIPALRQAKEAYDPDRLLNKWRVELS